MRMRLLSWSLVMMGTCAVAGCDSSEPVDAAGLDGAGPDAGLRLDGGPGADAGTPRDAATVDDGGRDAGATDGGLDASPGADSGATDGGLDAGPADASADSGARTDSGATDGGLDAGPADAGSCGSGTIEPGEDCDDENEEPGDGCSAACAEEPGWTCVGVPSACTTTCGDAITAGAEECDDANLDVGDGCDGCTVEVGWDCGSGTCVPSICGNGIRSPREACDDANTTGGDGCDSLCRPEPGFACASGGCSPVCGDGWRLGSEVCDDGNGDDGDGCSTGCTLELGATCTEPSSGESVSFPIVYRDFRAAPQTSPHPDFETFVTGLRTEMVAASLDLDGRPLYEAVFPAAVTGPAEFAQWFRPTPGVNVEIVDALPLALDLGLDPTGATVRFDSAETGGFFPIDTRGFGNYGSSGRNFHFTSELRFRFRYTGGERIDLTGDDDLWVFINGALAIDLGGVHVPESGAVTLSSTVNPSVGVVYDPRFEIFEGGVYEVALFHAERRTAASNLSLTLSDFVLAGNTSVCSVP